MTERARIIRETTKADGRVSRRTVQTLPTGYYVDYTSTTDKDKLKGTKLTRVSTFPLQREHIQGEDKAKPVVGVEWKEGEHEVRASLLVKDGEARLPRADGSHLVFDVTDIIQKGKVNQIAARNGSSSLNGRENHSMTTFSRGEAKNRL